MLELRKEMMMLWFCLLYMAGVGGSPPVIPSLNIVTGKDKVINMCSDEVRYLAGGVLTHPSYPEFVNTELCSCNFSTVQNFKVYLQLKLHLQTEQGSACEPMLYMPPYEICPSMSSNTSVTVVVRQAKDIMVTMNNPNKVNNRFLVKFAAQRPLKIHCQTSLLMALPPIRGGGGTFDDPDVNGGGDKQEGNYTVGIIASIVIVLVVVIIIIAAIIRWRCVVSQRKKDIKDSQGGHRDNPAYLQTPKSSIFDISSGQVPHHHTSFSSMLGLNKDLQPVEAPLTGLGALAAHTEPRRPSMGSLRSVPSRGGGVGGLPQQNGEIGGGPHVNPVMNSYTPPQPRRPAPPLADEHITNIPQYGEQWPITGPAKVNGISQRPTSYPSDDQDYRPVSYPNNDQDYHRPIGNEPQYSQPNPQRQSLPLIPNQNSHPNYQDQRPRSVPVHGDEPIRNPQVAPVFETAAPIREPLLNTAPPSLENPYQVPRSLKPYDDPDAPPVSNHPSQQPPGAPPEVTATLAPPEVITPYSFPIMLPPDKAFNISADDLPFMDDEEDDDMYSRRGTLTPPTKVKVGGWRGGTKFEPVGECASRVEYYVCGYCSVFEERYGRIMCHLVQNHPDHELLYHHVTAQPTGDSTLPTERHLNDDGQIRTPSTQDPRTPLKHKLVSHKPGYLPPGTRCKDFVPKQNTHSGHIKGFTKPSVDVREQPIFRSYCALRPVPETPSWSIPESQNVQSFNQLPSKVPLKVSQDKNTGTDNFLSDAPNMFEGQRRPAKDNAKLKQTHGSNFGKLAENQRNTQPRRPSVNPLISFFENLGGGSKRKSPHNIDRIKSKDSDNRDDLLIKNSFEPENGGFKDQDQENPGYRYRSDDGYRINSPNKKLTETYINLGYTSDKEDKNKSSPQSAKNANSVWKDKNKSSPRPDDKEMKHNQEEMLKSSQWSGDKKTKPVHQPPEVKSISPKMNGITKQSSKTDDTDRSAKAATNSPAKFGNLSEISPSVKTPRLPHKGENNHELEVPNLKRIYNQRDQPNDNSIYNEFASNRDSLTPYGKSYENERSNDIPNSRCSEGSPINRSHDMYTIDEDFVDDVFVSDVEYVTPRHSLYWTHRSLSYTSDIPLSVY